MSAERFSHGAVRSRVRRQLLANPGRARNYIGRALAVAGGGGLAIMLAVAVASESLPKTFPFVIVYGLHDHVWLVLRGYLWTAQFPYALIWAVPVVVAVAVLVIEVLTPFGLRGLHRRFLLVLMRRGHDPLRKGRPADATLATRWQDLSSAADHARGGFALRLAIEQREAAWAVLREARLTGQGLPEGECRMLRTATRWCLLLDPAGPRTVLAALEVLALPVPMASGDLVALLGEALPAGTAIEGQVAEVRGILSTLASPAHASGQGAAILQRLTQGGAQSPVILAAQAILLGALAGKDREPAARDWFEMMARLRMAEGSQGPAPQVAKAILAAMSLCDFPFWACLAETAALPQDRPTDPFLAQLAGPATAAERFAREGRP